MWDNIIVALVILLACLPLGRRLKGVLVTATGPKTNNLGCSGGCQGCGDKGASC